MFKPYSEDFTCQEVRRHPIIGQGALAAFRRLMEALRLSKPGLYLLVGPYGSGKTLIARRVTAELGGRVVYRSLRYGPDRELSCSGGRRIIGYIIDNFELFFERPGRYISLVEDYIAVSSHYPVVFILGVPIVVGSIGGLFNDVKRIASILSNIPGSNIIRLSLSSDEVREVLRGLGIDERAVKVPLKSPGIVLRALVGKGDDSIDLVVI